MYRLMYGVSPNTAKQIAVCDTLEQATTRIGGYLNERKIEFYYTRNWFEGDMLVVDYGSWSKFFYVVPVNNKTVSETLLEGSGA